MKRILGWLMLVCLLCTGCSAVDASAYQDLKDAVMQTAKQNSGQIALESSASGQDDMQISFCYCFDAEDVMHYCTEQVDQNGRRLFLEHHDGNVMQRWLLGHGSSSFDETDSEFVRYTRQNPYKYFTLLTALPQKGEILELTCTKDGTNTVYTVHVDPSKGHREKDNAEALISRTLIYRVGDHGMLSSYEQESVYQAKDSDQNCYTVKLTVSELGNITEVKLPEIE